MQRTTAAAEALMIVVGVVVVVVATLPTPKAVSSTAERCVVVDVVVVPLFTVCLQVGEADFRGRARDTHPYLTRRHWRIQTNKGFRS